MADPYNIDSHKMYFHPERTASIMAARGNWDAAKSVYPIYIEVAPIGGCNHRCRFCAVDYIGYNPVRLNADLFARRLREMGQLGVKSIMYAGEGEPLLNKEIPRITADTKASGIDVSFTTNATVLPDGFLSDALPHVSWIKASVNAGTADTYEYIHQAKPGDFDKALTNLSEIVEARNRTGGDCTVGIQSLLLPENADEIEALAKICRDQVKLDYLVVKPYSQHMFSDTHEYENVKYDNVSELEAALNSYNTDDFNVVFRSNTMNKHESGRQYERCYAVPFIWAYIMADGTVSACSCYLMDERFELGNINENTFQEIWEGEKRRRNFEFVENGLDISVCRKNCRMDEVNRYLDAVENDPPAHVNFI
jgi:cyclic pyranopterin phosphate synthase